MSKRKGCYYCFKTLNPNDEQINLQTFVKCVKCGHIYHLKCREINKNCCYCDNLEVEPIKISKPSPIKLFTRSQIVSIAPSQVFNLNNEGVFRQKPFMKEFQYYVKLILSILLTLFLVTIATFVGMFTYRISQINPVTFSSIMDAIFKQQVPNIGVIFGSSFCAMIFALLFYKFSILKTLEKTNFSSIKHSNYEKISNVKIKKNPLICFIACIIALVVFDFFLFDFYLLDIINFKINWLIDYQEILYAQCGTFAMIIILLPIHKGLTSISVSSPKSSHSQLFKNLYGLIRLSFATLLLILLVGYINSNKLTPSLYNEVFFSISFGEFSFTFNLLLIGTLFTSIAMASILYWPPNCRSVKWKFGFIRLLLFVICILAIGIIYRNTNDTELLLNSMKFSSILMFIMLPIQYAIS